MDKKQLTKLISAFAMADGGLYRRGENHNAYFAMNMRKKNEDYVMWVADTLAELTGVKVREFVNADNSPEPMLNVFSKTHPALTAIHGRLYRDNYKGLDEHIVQHIDWEVLAIFYMADGSLFVEAPNEKKGLKNPSPNVSLHMKRLSYGDQWMLKKLLKDVLDLEWNICKQFSKGKTYYYMRLRNKDIPAFMEGIAPYMKESFAYKLYTKSSAKADDDIVCSAQQCAEESRNDSSL